MPEPLPVPGYTSQSEAAVALVAQNKMIEELVQRQIDLHTTNTAIDQRMVALARTNMQQAFMWLNRAVFQPERIKGEIDLSQFWDTAQMQSEVSK